MDGSDGYRLYIDNKLIIDNWKKQTYSTSLVNFNFVQGKSYSIRVEFYEAIGNAHIRMVWTVGVSNNWKTKINEATTLAKTADIAVIVAGINEGEFQDRASLELPGHQQELIQQVAATSKPVVVILIGGSAITMTNWLPKISSVLYAWYPGEEAGRAVADILFGDANPAGRLPVTFPISEAQLPLVYNHKPTGRGDDYINGSGLPLFPFGYGLSYTQFTYSDIQVDKRTIAKNELAIVRCKITNSGKRAGDEVVQLYIRDILASVSQPVLALKGFQRISLQPGETKEVSFTITPELLTMLNEELKPVIEPGDFRIMIGSSSRNLPLKETITVTE